MSYLVLFVADVAGDHHADALRDLARSVPGAGFFDEPDGGAQRTVGAYTRVERLDEEQARRLIEQAAALSQRLGARLEVQFDERVLGHLHDGVADAPLAGALAGGR